MTSKMFVVLLVVSGILPTSRALVLEAKANPIRRVVNMLQAMQTKVTEEGEKEEALMKKFMCYCKTNKGGLQDSIAEAEAKGPELQSAIEESTAEHEQLQADLKAHKEDREAAKKSVAEANAVREKAAAEYAAANSESLANIAAIEKAVAALEKGAAGGFLQTNAARVVKKLVESQEAMLDVDDRQDVLAFLSGSSSYSPQSGQITGILKQIGDTMAKDMAEATAAEEKAIQEHEALVAAKTKEIAAHTKAIEEKSIRVGEVAVAIANMKNELKDLQGSLEEDRAFLAELEKGCGTKEQEWEERQKTRSEELLALSETIKLLNDDDSLELFKKALPTPQASFIQLSRSMSDLRARALVEVRAARSASTEGAPGLDLIALALNGKTTGGFDKVVAMIDKMVETLKAEQQSDDEKKTYCGNEFDQADDKKKGLETTMADEEAAASRASEAIATLSSELDALAAGIRELDKAVAQATEQRQQEHIDFNELMALDTQAKELLGVAKNRLNKFYNPKLYIPPPKKELTQEQKIYNNTMKAVAMVQNQEKPPPAPETFEGAYKKKGEETSGVIAMVDMLIKDLDKEMTIAETQEKEDQKDYEAMMADAKAKRAADSKSISQKEQNKADLEGELQNHKDAKAAAGKDHAATLEYISGLHGECDWLLKYHEARKGARASEVDSLNNAKAVLSGADYSLVQLHEKHHLRSNSKGCGPQVSVSFSTTEDAAGTAVFGDNQALSDGACNAVGGEIKLVKFCGPGTLTLSRMTCNNHDYKAHTYEHKASEYTTNCETISTQDTNVDGHLGSWSVKC